jgi:hypothetical protein
MRLGTGLIRVAFGMSLRILITAAARLSHAELIRPQLSGMVFAETIPFTLT